MLVKLNFTESPNFNTRTLRSSIKTPFLLSPLPIKLNDILVRKKSFTTLSGRTKEKIFPNTPPKIAPTKRDIAII